MINNTTDSLTIHLLFQRYVTQVRKTERVDSYVDESGCSHYKHYDITSNITYVVMTLRHWSELGLLEGKRRLPNMALVAIHIV